MDICNLLYVHCRDTDLNNESNEHDVLARLLD